MEKSDVKVLVITGFGLNCEKETSAAFRYCGATPELVHLNDILHSKRSLSEFHILAFIGGFSFGDHLGAGTIFANRVKFQLRDQLEKFIADGKLVKPAYFTVLFNGVLVHNHREQIGTTIWRQVAKYTPHAPEESLSLQDLSQPVRYRNIWVVEKK